MRLNIKNNRQRPGPKTTPKPASTETYQEPLPSHSPKVGLLMHGPLQLRASHLTEGLYGSAGNNGCPCVCLPLCTQSPSFPEVTQWDSNTARHGLLRAQRWSTFRLLDRRHWCLAWMCEGEAEGHGEGNVTWTWCIHNRVLTVGIVTPTNTAGLVRME